MFRILPFGLVLLFLLTACGGGNGGGGNPMNEMPSDDDESRMTPTDVQEQVNQVSATANTLLMTDLVATSRSAVHANTRGITTCRGTGCESEPAYGEPYWFLNELAALFTDANLRVEAPLYGVNTGVLTGRTSVVDRDDGVNYTTDYTVYGGWLDHTFFGVQRTRYQGEGFYGSVDGVEDLIAFSGGAASGSNPMTGSAEWNGLVVAVDATAPTQPVNGQAALTYDFESNTLDALFSNLRGARTYGDLSWTDLAVTNGRFSQGSGANSIDGTFYGAGHEEVGGVFERSQLIGAFGATRQ